MITVLEVFVKFALYKNVALRNECLNINVYSEFNIYLTEYIFSIADVRVMQILFVTLFKINEKIFTH